VRLEKLDLDMISSSPVLALCVYLWGGPAEVGPPYGKLSRDFAQLKRSRLDNGRAFVACGGQGTRKLSTGRSREEKLKGPPVTLASRTPGFAAKARQDDPVQSVRSTPRTTALVPRSVFEPIVC